MIDLPTALLFGLALFGVGFLTRPVGPRPDPVYAWLSRVMDSPARPMFASAVSGAATGGTRDHVPFPESPTGDQTADEGKRKLRDRFRKGLTKTRDLLNRDVTEAVGAGPVSEAFDELEEILIRSDVGVDAATQLSAEMREIAGLNSDNVAGALRSHMRSLLADADRRLRINPAEPSLWLIVGVNGAGKTTTIAKLANLAVQAGLKPCLAAADTFRAAAVEQLQTWGERIGVPVISQGTGADPGAVVFDAIDAAKARGYDLVIVDTAGRLQNRKPLMDELAKVTRVVDRHPGLRTESLLVIDATTGQNGISQAKGFGEVSDITGVVLAKLDGTAKGGIVFAVERVMGVPVKAVGMGENFTDIAPFDPDAFVDALFEVPND